jgi:hypothetical protein
MSHKKNIRKVIEKKYTTVRTGRLRHQRKGIEVKMECGHSRTVVYNPNNPYETMECLMCSRGRKYTSATLRIDNMQVLANALRTRLRDDQLADLAKRLQKPEET